MLPRKSLAMSYATSGLCRRVSGCARVLCAPSCRCSHRLACSIVHRYHDPLFKGEIARKGVPGLLRSALNWTTGSKTITLCT